MFHVLHKVYVGILFALLGCVLFYIYQNRMVFSPGADFVRALWIRQEAAPIVAAEITGDVVQVMDLSSFQMKVGTGYLYNVRLGGLEFPFPDERDLDGKKLRRIGKTNLSDLVLSKKVHVKFTYISEHRSGVGTVYLGETNVNAVMAAAGFAKPKRQYLKGLSIDQLYALLRAERAAKTRKLGIWQEPDASTNEPPVQLTAETNVRL